MLRSFLPSVVRFSEADGAVVYVADNGSTDASVAMLRREFPSVHLILLEENHGFADGYNLALKQVEAEYVVLLNSDVEVTEHWLVPLAEYMDAYPERQLPAGRQHFVQLLRRSLRDVRECLLPGGRFLPRRHRGGRRGHADELLQLRRQIKATSAKRRELPPLFSSSAFFQANRHDLSTPRIEWGI